MPRWCSSVRNIEQKILDEGGRLNLILKPITYPPFVPQSWPGKSVWMCFCLPHKAGRPSYLSQVSFNSLSWLLEVNWLEVRRGRHVWGRSCDNGGIVKGKKVQERRLADPHLVAQWSSQGALRWWGWAVAPGLKSLPYLKLHQALGRSSHEKWDPRRLVRRVWACWLHPVTGVWSLSKPVKPLGTT